MVWFGIALYLITFICLAMRQARIASWALAHFVLSFTLLILGNALSAGDQVGLASSPTPPVASTFVAMGWGQVILIFVPLILLVGLSLPPVRRRIVTGPVLKAVRRILPTVSDTEQAALDAGTVSFDADLFNGRPDWDQMLKVRDGTLTDEEQAFLDGPTTQLCSLIDDWHTRHQDSDLSPQIWQFMRDKGFFGMLIAKEHGGLGFSAQAQSKVVSKIASRSVAAGITVMVPNSLGPGELLEKYGTDAQKNHYLTPLAKGEEIPCFALTGPPSGSDAAGMHDVGVVCEQDYDGKKTLGIRLNFEKRYITLAPVATLMGLAFVLHDPDGFLGDASDLGITLALIPTSHEGIEIGHRHFPARSAFMNGPIRGKDVFIPLDFVIGGKDYVGKGWQMLMDALSVGRAISLPAIGTVSIKYALRTSSAYARLRRQFGLSVGQMEGVSEPLARLVKDAYLFEAARSHTAALVDEGAKPSVLSALLKYTTTEAMRDRMNDAMDIHGGRAICDGPSNYLFGAYQAVPVAITVEGANILTRTLITFSQGALRAHPYLFKEIDAARNPDIKAGEKAFDKAFCGHTSFMLRNFISSFVHNISLGKFAHAPQNSKLAHTYRQLSRAAQNFALAADIIVVIVGGHLKRKQAISGRMADALSALYLSACALKRFEDDGALEADMALVETIVQDQLYHFNHSISTAIDQLRNPLVRGVLKLCLFPLGNRHKATPDYINHKLAQSVLQPGDRRDRLTRDIYVSDDGEDVTGRLEVALESLHAHRELDRKFRKSIRRGNLSWRHDRDIFDDAIKTDILSDNEAKQLKHTYELIEKVVNVDEFEPHLLKRQT